jgi:integrase
MPKPRSKQHQGLPARWRHAHGAYSYSVPPGLEAKWDGKKLFRLGATLHEASRTWEERMNQAGEQGDDRVKTIADLLDRYSLEVLPTKAPASQVSNWNQMRKVREVFGSMLLSEPFKPQLIYKFVDARSKKKEDPKSGRVKGGMSAAHREVELLSHAFTKAVEWGYIDRHPFKGEVRLKGEAPRTRYVQDWEIIEALKLDSRRKKGSVLMIQAYLRLKLLTGLAQGDLLRLQPGEHFKEDGIHNVRHKTALVNGKVTIYQWTEELRVAVDMALEARPKKDSKFLFCTRTGKGYVNEVVGRSSAWKSMWQRFMARVMKETKVKESFTEHDLRAKVASDAESLEHAQALLAHADPSTTKRIYRRKAELVMPLNRAISVDQVTVVAESDVQRSVG